jgi:hypothetical protein
VELSNLLNGAAEGQVDPGRLISGVQEAFDSKDGGLGGVLGGGR